MKPSTQSGKPSSQSGGAAMAVIITVVVIAIGVGAYSFLRQNPEALSSVLPESVKKSVSDALHTGTPASDEEKPVVFNNEIGVVTVAEKEFQENITAAETRNWWGINFAPEIISAVEVKGRYRYSVPVPKEWHIVLRGKTCVAMVPAPAPVTPVTFNPPVKNIAGSLVPFTPDRRYSQLVLNLHSILAVKSLGSNHALTMRNDARAPLTKLLLPFLQREHGWKSDPAYTIKIIFPGEPTGLTKPYPTGATQTNTPPATTSNSAPPSTTPPAPAK